MKSIPDSYYQNFLNDLGNPGTVLENSVTGWKDTKASITKTLTKLFQSRAFQVTAAIVAISIAVAFLVSNPAGWAVAAIGISLLAAKIIFTTIAVVSALSFFASNFSYTTFSINHEAELNRALSLKRLHIKPVYLGL